MGVRSRAPRTSVARSMRESDTKAAATARASALLGREVGPPHRTGAAARVLPPNDGSHGLGRGEQCGAPAAGIP